jgi:hypothetical protein
MAPSRLAAALALLTLVTGSVQAQQPPPQPPPAGPPPQSKSPDDLDRIKAAPKRPNTIILTDPQVRFYVEIRERFPSVEEMFRGVDLLYGPRAGGPAFTHAEYLSMVTPRDTIASSGGIKPTEMLQFAVTNWLGQMLVRKALEEINNAKSEAEVQEIRDRITRELAALTAGRGGGL